MVYKTAVVIPNWNGADFISECIDSLIAQTERCLIIVVENGSTDGSRALLQSYGTKIVVLQQDKNWGFAEGVNIGIRYGLEHNCAQIALLNNDATVDPDWLQELHTTLVSNPAIGIATSKILINRTGLLDTTGDWYSTTGMPFPRGRGEIDSGQYDKDTEVFGASGGASLYRSEMLRQIGLMDADFFAYYEDVDISFRAQLYGWKVAYAPHARVYHMLSATSSKLGDFRVYQSAKNFWFVYIKNLPMPLVWKYLPAATYRYCRMFAARIIRGGSPAFMKGFAHALLLFPKKFKQRSTIQRSRVVSAQYVASIIYKGKPPIVRKQS